MIASESGLEMLGHGMRSVEYGGGTIADLWLSGSNEIMKKLEPFLKLPTQIPQDVKYFSDVVIIPHLSGPGYEHLIKSDEACKK